MFITHFEYDKQYDVRSSSEDDYKISIPESISPGGNQKILDAIQCANLDQTGFGEEFVMVTMRDSNMHYHKINPRNQDIKRKTTLTKAQSSRCCMWPYTAFADAKNQVWLFCSFNMKALNRLKVPFHIKHTKIQ